ncbi:dihydropteroate synthase [Prevotella disiens JCM 6334 = ATCC 29426]|uniref:dihydropteroate synthase n=4 Tax=Prevotella disiens TaxID=28130 RepID=A0A096C410_9BACT|nr:dihydropteroate synthase [Prevotella disiens]EFL46223.1 dihydropteroate synthase [Prevotella disiens FB035-09AN]ERJ75866.1 dihydropteroate synthase [Prevotella disiens JCM 6334 = ATCC 29426]KGF49692.1 dihydropteroate synthase [Prevotella disiens DNF00882]
MEHERFSGQMRPINYTMNVRGELIDLSHPSVMGILNVTPDSFYANSRMQTEAEIYNRANQIMEEGATIIDVGACSTRPGRPGGEVVDEEEEMRRLAMALPIIRKAQPNAIISIDTFRASVARKTVEEFGADIINDVEEGADPDMFRTVADLGVPYILMSKAANLHDMLIDFAREVQELRNLGQKDIILDPGFGFGKEPVNGNYALMGVLERLHTLELPILVGISRKRMIHQLLGITAKESLNGTTALNVISLMKGASILRVHDVKEAVEAIKIYDCLVANTPKEEGF